MARRGDGTKSNGGVTYRFPITYETNTLGIEYLTIIKRTLRNCIDCANSQC